MTPRYDLLRRLLWLMGRLPDEKVDLTNFYADCGTVACIAGHAGLDFIISRATGLHRGGRQFGLYYVGMRDGCAATCERASTAFGIDDGGDMFAPAGDQEIAAHGTHRAIAIARLTKFLSDAGELHGPIPGVTDTTAAVDAIKASMARAVETQQLVGGDD